MTDTKTDNLKLKKKTPLAATHKIKNLKEKVSKVKMKSETETRSINLADKTWRLMAMIAFAFIGIWSFFLLIVLSAVQFVVVIVNDKINFEIKTFMEGIGHFITQVYKFLSYSSEEIPFPFSPFPDGK
ncbi:MAG: DUF4389 domain-containing protein [Sphingomonadales bacterium]